MLLTMKIALLGLGFMGATHLKALKNIRQVELVAVASDDDRMADCSAPRKYRDWRDAVADPQAEAFDICLPTNLHASAAVAALNAGKHVLVEKPMALDAAEADAMIEAARRSGRILMVAQVLRFFPAYRVMADVVKSGRLGAVRAAMFRRRSATPAWGAWLTDKRASGGGIFDLMVHDVDMCLHLFGPPEAVSATGYSEWIRLLPEGLWKP
jgi:predicted dehydrogenase